MQKFLHHFNVSSNRISKVKIDEYDIQSALKESELLITDYSSVFFDFAYMVKPILFYQFDYDNFRKGQYAEGYYNYKDGLGEAVNDLDEILNVLATSLENGNKISEKYKKRCEDFFTIRDSNNCKRIVEELKNVMKEV